MTVIFGLRPAQPPHAILYLRGYFHSRHGLENLKTHCSLFRIRKTATLTSGPHDLGEQSNLFLFFSTFHLPLILSWLCLRLAAVSMFV